MRAFVPLLLGVASWLALPLAIHAKALPQKVEIDGSGNIQPAVVRRQHTRRDLQDSSTHIGPYYPSLVTAPGDVQSLTEEEDEDEDSLSVFRRRRRRRRRRSTTEAPTKSPDLPAASRSASSSTVRKESDVYPSRSTRTGYDYVGPSTTVTTTQDCRWNKWSEWSECTASCGTGDWERHRTIWLQPKNGGRECRGPPEQSQECNTVECPTTPPPTTTTIAPKTESAAPASAETPEAAKKKEQEKLYIFAGLGALGIIVAGLVAYMMMKPEVKKRPPPGFDDFGQPSEEVLLADDDEQYDNYQDR